MGLLGERFGLEFLRLEPEEHRGLNQRQLAKLRARILKLADFNAPLEKRVLRKREQKETEKKLRPKPANGKKGLNELLANQEKCSICWADFEAGASVIIMKSCEHIFHKKCIFEWLKTRAVCPIDKKHVS